MERKVCKTNNSGVRVYNRPPVIVTHRYYSVSSTDDSSDDSDDEVLITNHRCVRINSSFRPPAVNVDFLSGSEKSKHSGKIRVSNCSAVQVGNSSTMVINGPLSLPGTYRNRSKGPVTSKQSHTENQSTKSDLTSSTTPATQNDFLLVCKHMGRSWKRVARNLGLEDAHIERIQLDYAHEGVQEMTWQFLKYWQEKNGNNATLKTLAEALFDSDMRALALKL